MKISLCQTVASIYESYLKCTLGTLTKEYLLDWSDPYKNCNIKHFCLANTADENFYFTETRVERWRYCLPSVAGHDLYLINVVLAYMYLPTLFKPSNCPKETENLEKLSGTEITPNAAVS